MRRLRVAAWRVADRRLVDRAVGSDGDRGDRALQALRYAQARTGRLGGRFDLSYFNTSAPFLLFRVLGGVFAILIFFELGPPIILEEATGGLMFNTLVAAVAVIVPIGAVFITLFVAFGTLEFIGTLARPLMRPLFRVPGRGALDAIASYVELHDWQVAAINPARKTAITSASAADPRSTRQQRSSREFERGASMYSTTRTGMT